jgi:hypothetical protein
MNDNPGGRRIGRRMWSLRTGLLAVMAGAAVLAAACGGGSNSPHVTGRDNGSGTPSGTPGTAPPTDGHPAQLLNEWAACMRSHGDAGQVAPTIDASKVIHMTVSPALNGGWTGQPSGNNPDTGPGLYCIQYIEAAQKLLGYPADLPPDAGYVAFLEQQGNPATLAKYSECMRARGISDFPDPTGDTLQIQPNPNPRSPGNSTFVKASTVCSKQTGVPPLGIPETYPGMVVLNGVPGPA